MKVKHVFGWSLALLLLGGFWLFVIVPTYPFFFLMHLIARLLDVTDRGCWEFTRDWFCLRIIP